jgi:hypothetical protein
MVLFPLVVLVAIVLGLIGAVGSGLVYLLLIGCVLLAADLVYAFVRLRRPRPRHR